MQKICIKKSVRKTDQIGVERLYIGGYQFLEHGGGDMLQNIIDRVKWEIRGGKTPDEAIMFVADTLGLADEGNIVKYLRKLFKEV